MSYVEELFNSSDGKIMNFEPISLSASEICCQEGEVSPNTENKGLGDIASLPSCADVLQTEESFISEASTASSWLNLIQNKMKIQSEYENNTTNSNCNDEEKTQSIVSTAPIINDISRLSMNTTQQTRPAPSVPSTQPAVINNISPNAALHSLLSSATNNIAFNPYSIYSPNASILNTPFNNTNIATPNNSILNTFTFPRATTTTTTTRTTTTNNNNMNNQININPTQQLQTGNNNNNNNNSVCIRSITVKFLTMYYNTLHSNPGNLKRFYHLNAEIDRSDIDLSNSNTFANIADKLSVLKNVLFVDIEKILYQRSIQSSILIRVNGTMKFPQNITKPFEQIFFIYKSKQGFWLIQNDILWLMESLQCVELTENHQENNDTIDAKTYRNILENSKEHNNDNNIENNNDNNMSQHNASMVNKRMINKFYHDSSYQQFDNNLAIFIRPIPNNITHSKLCGILRTNLLKQCNLHAQNVDICIDYIDVNYHKQFAFVYCGNQETMDVALSMNQIYINGQASQIQRKRSHNGPRKFFPKKRKQI